MRAEGTRLFGHPRAVFSLSVIGLCYIAAYAGIIGHLVLFLTAAPEDYGFGWTNDEAIRLYG